MVLDCGDAFFSFVLAFLNTAKHRSSSTISINLFCTEHFHYLDLAGKY